MKFKVLIPVILILGGISWLALSNLSKANYFYKVNELDGLGGEMYERPLKVKGRIVAGTIEAKTKPVKFVIHEEDKQLQVHYVGEEPLPDMFKDHAEAVVEGTMRKDGVFEAVHLQAKCASKYEALAPSVEEAQTSQPAESAAKQPTGTPAGY